MSIPERDIVRLRHMLDAAEDAQHFVKGKTRQDLDSDRVLMLAVLKSIEIVGEAASRISEPTRESISDIPWLDVIGMRNRLIHGYYDINLQTVWDTVQDDLPPLIASLRAALEAFMSF